MFGGDDAVVNELVRLRDWNASANHYVLGAYHNALLFSVLPDQLEFLNEAAAADGPMDFCGGPGAGTPGMDGWLRGLAAACPDRCAAETRARVQRDTL